MDLQSIRFASEESLVTLDLDDLLPLLLDHVLELLQCDTAVVLLLDPAADQLVARAARGLEEEVRQGVRIPLGAGFAGRVAAERRPIALDHVDTGTVINPILIGKGVQSMLGVPLVTGGTLMGVLHVGSFSPRSFNESEVLLLELVAEKVAAAAQGGIAQSERRAASVLQRSLLPSALPKHPHIAFASRYVPAERGDVGGDWYDAFVLPGGEVWVMIGDVAGHGLNPAIVMSRLRSAMRAYALLGMSPEDVLRGANRKLQYFEPGAMATVVCGVLKPPFDELRMCRAGHLPPLMIEPDGTARFLETPPVPPLGVVAELDAHSSRWKVEEGSTIVLYTDGLVERRGEDITDGLARLSGAVRSEAPERLCIEIMKSMIGSYVPADDVAVLALRVNSHETRVQPLHLPGLQVRVTRSELFACEAASIKKARRFMAECVAHLGLECLPDVQLMVSELATNAVQHAGSGFDITVEQVSPDAVRVEVRDFGLGTPRLSHREEEVGGGGRGLHIVDLLSQSWGTDSRQGGTGKSTWFIVTTGETGDTCR
ncbi:MAG TPA: SpoIIE family protein phosphatase [Acidimicrobiales bacterium]